jgi:hypothetical protein
MYVKYKKNTTAKCVSIYLLFQCCSRPGKHQGKNGYFTCKFPLIRHAIEIAVIVVVNTNELKVSYANMLLRMREGESSVYRGCELPRLCSEDGRRIKYEYGGVITLTVEPKYAEKTLS